MEKEIAILVDQLKKNLAAFPENARYLDLSLESAAKHIPTYLKIVKGHIDQLEKVLGLENHNHRNLGNTLLAEPVQQLMQLFKSLEGQDLHLLEALAHAARHWQSAPTIGTLEVQETMHPHIEITT